MSLLLDYESICPNSCAIDVARARTVRRLFCENNWAGTHPSTNAGAPRRVGSAELERSVAIAPSWNSQSVWNWRGMLTLGISFIDEGCLLAMPDTESQQRRRIRADLERRLDDLPVLPAVAAHIASLDPTAGDFASRVEDLARLDPPLAARLLRLCDCRISQPGSVSEAIVRVGARPLAETITSLSVMRLFVPTTIGQRNLWIHAIGTALTARCIAQFASASWQLAPEHAYLAGLMHDLGRFVMYDRTPAELGQVDETHWSSPRELVAAEIQVCGFDHAFLGGLACERWRFPELVTDMVREHHVYDRQRSAARKSDLARLVRVLQAADLVNTLVLTRPECISATDQEKTILLNGLYEGVGWSDADTPCHPAALAAELHRIDEDCKHLAVFLGLAAPQRAQS